MLTNFIQRKKAKVSLVFGVILTMILPFILVQTSAYAFTNHYVFIKSMANSMYVCADNNGLSPLIANSATAGDWQKFLLIDNGSGYISLQSNTNGKFVTAPNGGADALIASAISIGAAEKFLLIDNGDGTNTLQANINGKFVCATSAGSSPLIANSNAISVYEKFQVINADGGSAGVPDGNTIVGIKCAGLGKYLRTISDNKVMVDGTSLSFDTRFRMKTNGDGTVSFIAVSNYFTVTSANNGIGPCTASVPQIGVWEKFTAQQNSDKTFSFKNLQSGNWLSGGGPNNQLTSDRTVIGSYEKFSFEYPTLTSNLPYNPEIYVGSAFRFADWQNSSQFDYVRTNASGFHVHGYAWKNNLNQTIRTNVLNSFTGTNSVVESDIEYVPYEYQFVDEIKASKPGLNVKYSTVNIDKAVYVNSWSSTYTTKYGLTYPTVRAAMDQYKSWYDARGTQIISLWTNFCGPEEDPALTNWWETGNWLDALSRSYGIAHDAPGDILASTLQTDKRYRAVHNTSIVTKKDYNKKTIHMLNIWNDKAFTDSKNMVRDVEKDGSSIPDVWIVNNFADEANAYANVPEANIDGTPYNSVSGFAYWLIKHTKNTPGFE